MKHPLILAGVFSTSILASPLGAELYIEEAFNYPSGFLTPASEWMPLSSPAEPRIQVLEGGSLHAEGLPESSGSRVLVDQNGVERASLSILPAITSGTAYYSILLRMTELPTDFTYALHFNGSRYSGRTFFRAVEGDRYQVGIGNVTRATYADEAFAVGDTLHIVVRYTFLGENGQDEVALFLNPDVTSVETPTPDLVMRDRAESRIDSFVLRQSSGAGSFEADELRIGTTWDAVMGREEISPVVAVARAEAIRWSRHHFEHRLSWNAPGRITDLGVGLWAVPAAFDWDGDGDIDLLVSSGGRPDNGIYLFERDGSDVLTPRGRLDRGERQLRLSHTTEGPALLTPGFVYRDFRNGPFGSPEAIPFEQEFYAGRVNHWNLVDWNGNGVDDLLIGISDWREYGWDDAYNDQGEWTAGPLRGLVYLVENAGTNEAPDYQEAVQVMADGEPIDVYGAPSPVYVDWDGDGDLDLICGEFLDRITFFENIGTREEPEFAAGRFLEVDGEALHLELQMLQVSAADWDGDGDPDLIVGKEDGRVVLIENLGGGVIAPPRYLQQRAEQVKVGALTTPFPFDWDGDGLVDIITGNTAGHIVFLKNLGGSDQPTWAPEERLTVRGEEIRFLAGENMSIQGPAEAKWGYTNIFVVDWNNNGLPDILANNIMGRIVWFKNIGTRTEPALDGPFPVLLDGDEPVPYPAWNWWKPEGRELITQWRTIPHAADIDGDGRMDLVLQDHEGFLAWYQRVGDPETSDVVASGKRIFHMTEGDSTYNHIGEATTRDDNGDGTNDLAQRTSDGLVTYYARDPLTRELYTRTAHGPIGADDKLVQDVAHARLLRLASGWAGQSGRRKFRLVDWDGDGDLDLLVNSRGINFLENVSTDGGFEFIDRGRIIPHILAGHSTTPSIVDWDQDGVPDLLVGAEDGFFYYYPRQGFDEMVREVPAP